MTRIPHDHNPAVIAVYNERWQKLYYADRKQHTEEEVYKSFETCPQCGQLIHLCDWLGKKSHIVNCVYTAHVKEIEDDALSYQEKQDRRLCATCGKPWIGENASCHCGFESLEEKETFFRTSPKSKKANKPDGDKGHGHLRFRRARAGY